MTTCVSHFDGDRICDAEAGARMRDSRARIARASRSQQFCSEGWAPFDGIGVSVTGAIPGGFVVVVEDRNASFATGQLLSYGDTGTPGNVSAPVTVGFGGWQHTSRGIPAGGVAPPSRMPNMLSRRALPATHTMQSRCIRSETGGVAAAVVSWEPGAALRDLCKGSRFQGTS